MKCKACKKEIKTQKDWWTEKCEKSLVPGGSHQVEKNELVKLNKSRM